MRAGRDDGSLRRSEKSRECLASAAALNERRTGVYSSASRSNCRSARKVKEKVQKERLMENQEQVNCSAPAAPALAIFGDADPAPHSRSTDAPSVARILESRGRV